MARKTRFKPAPKTILLLVEGDTEEVYFNEVKRVERFSGFTIRPKKAKHSAPVVIIKEAIEFLNREEFDSVWCVLDRDKLFTDNVTEDLQQTYQNALSRGVLFADSMPSFEVWFLAHYEKLHTTYASQESVITCLRKHIPEYKKERSWLVKTQLYTCLKDKLNVAIDNCRSQTLSMDEFFTNQKTNCNVYKIFQKVNASR